jgi:choline dehydrogenase-like flavoprotein
MPEIVPKEPRGKNGRAPDVLKPGDTWMPMKMYPEGEEVDFAIVGTGAGGGALAARLAEGGFSVVAFDAGPWFRPLDEFASDEIEQTKVYWLDNRITAGSHPLELGRNNSGKAVGGSTVHFMMVSLRFRPEWFKARTKLGYGFDWPVDWREMWRYYDETEDALKIAGPVNYPWGPPRQRYPYRPHEVNAAGLVLARGAEKLGIKWCPTPLATVSAPRGASPPCVYRGFCGIGCSTNAKQSALIVWIPRAVVAGAEIRDMAMVGRIELGANGRVTGVHYYREGRWRFQKAKNVVVAGYSIETPRLLLNSACPQFPNGLANSNGLVGKYFMVQSNDAVWGLMDEEIRWYKGPPSMAMTEHWNYTDEGKDFFGGYAYMGQGPLAVEWARALASGRGLWGHRLREEASKYIHQAGLKIVGEVLPREENQIELAEETDDLGLRRAKVVFGYCENDIRLRQHAVRFMRKAMEAAGAKDIWDTPSTAHLSGGCRMGDDPATSVVDANGRSWDIPNLWVCDGSLFPTVGGVNPSLTIQAMSLRIGDRIKAMAARGELERPAREKRMHAMAPAQ